MVLLKKGPMFEDVIIVGMFLLLDSIWIGWNYRMYNTTTQTIQGGKPMRLNYYAAAMTYMIMYMAMKWVVMPLCEMKKGGWMKCASTGGFVGFCCYGIYNFTNKAVFAEYPWTTAILDTMWGTFLFAITTVAVNM